MLLKGKILVLCLSIFMTNFLIWCPASKATENTKKYKSKISQDYNALNKYRLEFAYAVNKNWIAPKEAKTTNAKIYTSIVLKIMPDGSIKDIFVLDESGDKALDKAAIGAIMRTDPFKPHPKEFSIPYVEMGLRFNHSGVK